MHTHRFGKGGGEEGICPMNLIRGMAKGEGFVRQVQASCVWKCFRKHFCDVKLHCLHFIMCCLNWYCCSQQHLNEGA